MSDRRAHHECTMRRRLSAITKTNHHKRQIVSSARRSRSGLQGVRLASYCLSAVLIGCLQHIPFKTTMRGTQRCYILAFLIPYTHSHAPRCERIDEVNRALNFFCNSVRPVRLCLAREPSAWQQHLTFYQHRGNDICIIGIGTSNINALLTPALCFLAAHTGQRHPHS